MNDDPLIEVTVIGGYLGAGKTSLVNHVLRTTAEPLAVLVNDFGSINIDEELIVDRGQGTIELANGCICCSLADGFVAALDRVTGADPPPARLVVEASGVADPAQIAAYSHLPGLRSGAVVTVVDAEQVRAQAVDRFIGTTIVRQLEGADMVVVNKLDLIVPATGSVDPGLADWVANHVPDAAVVGAVQGRVPLAVLFGTEPQTAEARVGEPLAAHESWAFRSDEPTTRAAVEALMGALPAGVVRIKGVLSLFDDPRPQVLQGVGRRWTLEPAPQADLQGGCRVVAIGHPGALTEQWLASHLTTPTPEVQS